MHEALKKDLFKNTFDFSCFRYSNLACKQNPEQSQSKTMKRKFSFADMAPNEKVCKLAEKSCEAEGKRVDEGSKENMKLSKSSISKDCILNLSNSVSHTDQVSCLPDTIDKLTVDLTELEICNNELHIHNNTQLQSLPSVVGELQSIRVLNLSQNQLTELPDNLSNLKNLEILDLSDNKLENLPDSYSKLQRLRKLNIAGNKFVALPKCVANGMGTLRILNISQNTGIKMNVIPYSKYLESFLGRESGKCSKFPDWILIPKFFNLKEIELKGTQFEVFSLINKGGDLSCKTFSMASSSLSSPILEILLENMVCLEQIDVGNKSAHESGNVFNTIPIHVLKSPELITEINFRATSLPAVPPAIKQLRNLKKLDVGLNCISWLPEEFCELQHLEHLIIDGNGLIMLPEHIGNLESLQEIRAGKNALSRLPLSIKNIKNLKYIDIYDNKFEDFPSVLSEMDNLQGLDLELNFFSTDDVKVIIFYNLY